MSQVKYYHVSDTGLAEGVSLGRITVVLGADYDAAQSELAALREELARSQSLFNQTNKAIDRINALHRKRMAKVGQRLADAERRLGSVAVYVKNLCRTAGEQPSVATGYLHDVLDALTKPEEAKS